MYARAQTLGVVILTRTLQLHALWACKQAARTSTIAPTRACATTVRGALGPLGASCGSDLCTCPAAGPAAAQAGVVADDCATAQYRNVPSSGYGYGYQPGQARDEPVVDDGVWHVPAGYRYKNRHEAVTSGTQTARSRPQTAAPGWQPGYPATSAWQQPTAIPTAGPGVPNGAPVAPGGPWNGANPAVATGGAAPQLFPYFYPHAQLLPYTAYGLTAEQLAAAAQAQAVAATLAAAGKASGATQGGKPGGRRRHATFAPDSGSSSGAAGARSPRKRSKAKSKAKVASQQRVPATSAAPKAAAKAVRSPAPKPRHGDAKTSSATRRAMQQDRAAARAAARRRPARYVFCSAFSSRRRVPGR